MSDAERRGAGGEEEERDARRRDEGVRLPEPRNRARPRWVLAIPLAMLLGVALAMTVPSIPTLFSPPAGPPDTLRELRVALPTAPVLPPVRYLERAMAKELPRDSALRVLAARYNVTRTFARQVFEVAEEVGIDPELAFRLMRVESVFDADAVGSGGALGLCQLMYGTARDIDPSIKSRKEVMEPRTNMRLGFTNLKNMLELFDEDVRLAVIAYNRGEVAVQRALKRGKDPENGYGKLVLGPRHHGGKPYAGPGRWPAHLRSGAAAAPAPPTSAR